MRKHLQLKWMLTASTLLTTSFTLPAVARTAAGNDISRGIASTEEPGRAIYVNDDAAAKERPTAPGAVRGSTLVYWRSNWRSKESRSKPVPSANTESGKAPRSAAAEVSQFYRRDSVQSASAKILQANSHGHQATRQEIDQSGVPQVAETQAAETDPGMTYRGDHASLIRDYWGFDLSQPGVSRDPLHVQRDERGVFYISNTDWVGKHLS